MMNYPKSPRPRIKRCKSESNVRGLTIGNIHALQNVSKGPSLPILCQVGYLRRLVKNSRNLSSIAITLDNWNGIWLTYFLWVKKKKGKLCFSLSELDIMKDVPGISCWKFLSFLPVFIFMNALFIKK